ncbi:peptide chain release factor 1 [Roseomonas indoligenes]|uniref:Peptide chain release factor 1 n=1 Tax=Roseomonas indoligenes TaxID=2820811 RepID=A0A940N113_9PROT|nr:peptide chain release factor 1 [Pararoseomonas indoligenes]MBP0494745.1 peptide chain release factor 1 [Pararoseomonas indoligenes]
MTEAEIERAQEELDRLLNDPEVRMDPARVWALASRLSQQSGGAGTPR